VSFQTENLKLIGFLSGTEISFVNHFVSDFPFWKNMMGRADEHMALSNRTSL
jgi:hypothetical protein